MGVEGEEREKRERERKKEKQKQRQNHTEPCYITSHNSHALPFPFYFGCVLLEGS